MTVHFPGRASPLTMASDNPVQPAKPQAPQLVPGSISFTASMRGSSSTYSTRCASTSKVAKMKHNVASVRTAMDITFPQGLTPVLSSHRRGGDDQEMSAFSTLVRQIKANCGMPELVYR